jgi:glycosyltransferase involved in cell wall biosynthesis
MEAMACGLPVVATAVGGIPEILTHGETGLLVETGNINALADALITLLNSPDKCVQMGDAAAAFARAHLDARRTVDRLVEMYQGLLANRRKIA